MTIPNSETHTPARPVETRVPVIFRAVVKKPYITYVILAITILAFGIQYLSQIFFYSDLLFTWGGKINSAILQGEVWRLITPMFLHGGLIHLAFNMYALYSIGSSLERFYGHKRFLILYLIAGYAGNVLSFLLTANDSLGASTAVFGLVAAEVVFIFRNKKMFGAKARSMLINLAMVIVFNLSMGLSAGSRIDNWGHLGGLAGGLIFAWVAGPLYQLQSNLTGGFELADSSNKENIWWGFLYAAGLFTAMVIGKFLVK